MHINRNTNWSWSTRKYTQGTTLCCNKCNLLGAPPLEMLKPGVSLDDSFATETEPEEVDLDTSFHCSQEFSNLLQSILQSKRNTEIIATQLHY